MKPKVCVLGRSTKLITFSETDQEMKRQKII